MNIVLTGFMASGKTEISKAIAAMSRYKRLDTDELIERESGMTINELFERYGETGFRELEHKAVCSAAELDGYVIATGGGVPLNPDNIKALRENGVIINLAPDFEVIKERLESARATRPLLKHDDTEAIEKRFNDRRPFYDDCDFKIHIINGRTPRSYALEIMDVFKNMQERSSS